ncbi:putative signaling protein [Solidesulfovibrio magneticus RS-1]|uniref:diguanylate cyclase n=2 Tax=Solidesulfovibrio TaxID=2910984 RepID=C4XKS6_SOLM1|nr:putative signaling protein [Solidesulfovibrio magneticus RS-1]
MASWPLIMVKKVHFFILTLLIATTFSATTFRKIAHGTERQTLNLTQEEKKFLIEHPKLSMGVGIAFPPFQFVENSYRGFEFKGIAADTIRLLERRLGVTFEPVFNITFDRALELGREGKIDVFPCISWTPERADFLSYTSPYLSYPLVIISRSDGPFIGSVKDLNGLKVAEVKTLSTYSKVKNEFPEVTLDYQFEQDTESMLEAVSLGKAQACIVDLAVASYLINKRGLSNLKVAAPTPWGDNKLAMATPNSMPILKRILQKGLDSITPEEENLIRQKWLRLEYSSLTNPYHVLQWALKLTGLALLIFGIIFWKNRNLKREVEEKVAARELLKQANNYNRSLFEINTDPIMAIDREGVITDANKSTETITGLSRTELIGRKFSSLFTDDQKADQGLQDTLLYSSIKNHELEFTNINGKNTHAIFNFSVFKDETGISTGIFSAARDITERKIMEERLKEMATTDSLTGLNNRQHFLEHSSILFEMAKRHKANLSIALFDIDHFKQVNDTWGHEAGDLVLRELSKLALNCFRSSDIIGRIGGEEFAVIMPETDKEEAILASERFRKLVESTKFEYENDLLNITVSIGIAQFDPNTNTTINDLTKISDDALYTAKANGRNMVFCAKN